MPRKLRTLIEEDSFKVGVEKLGGARSVDEALAAVVDSLTLRPEAWPTIPRYGQMRLAKTDRVQREEGYDIPALSVWFYIHDEGTVRLMYVEEREEGDDLPF